MFPLARRITTTALVVSLVIPDIHTRLKQRTFNSPQANGRQDANLKSKVALAKYCNRKRLWTLNATIDLIPAMGRMECPTL